MPELPEVETVVKTLRPLMVNKTIKEIDIFHDRMVKPNVAQFKKTLIGKSIESIERIGKFILFFLTNDVVVISHLRMEGKYLEAKDPDTPLSRFARLVFTFNDGTRMIYDDMRKFGTFELSDDHDVIKFFEKQKDSPSKIANSAIYFMKPEIKEVVNTLNEYENDISLHVIPKLLGKIKAFELTGYFYDIGTPENLLLANE